MHQAALPAGTRPQRKRADAIVVVLCLAAFMAMLDVFVVNVAFTDIGASFHGSSLADLSWVLNAYTIVYAALLIPAGRLADRHGRKAGFLAGLTVFTLASAGCAVAPTLSWLVAFRVLQAAGAAVLTPTSLGLLLTALPAERRAGAVKIWATTSSFAAAVGPVVGGALVEVSWNWVFLINLPVGLVTFVGALRLIPESRDNSITRLPDPLGAGLLAVAIGAAALGLVKGDEWGWTGAATLGAFGVAVLGIAVLVARVLRHPAPVIDPALWRVPTFAWANVTVLVFCTAFGALFPSVVLWLENSAGYSAITTGVAILPGPLMVPIFAMVGQRLARRLPVGPLVAVGNLVFCAGAAMLAVSASAHARYATDILPGWIVTGIGIGLALPSMIAAATADLRPAQAATGSAVVNTGRQLGYVLGVAVLVAVLGTLDTSPHQTAAGFQGAWWFIAGAAALGAVTALGLTPRGDRSSPADT
ncbi:DHA2 family efflux MFS transporter permease subunit [Nonomuraea sediminis]|uniref:DHA2 family efflux MFS transporter permease subunit n=1 Tax=Nonomuraea sediminis TaxID=2835864 RepID=UPI001BDD0FB5|nr:DHA2 family efflux MFS transporter permease subunit [Nonomuraea sediminis]